LDRFIFSLLFLFGFSFVGFACPRWTKSILLSDGQSADVPGGRECQRAEERGGEEVLLVFSYRRCGFQRCVLWGC
jgi:hypothetical protein